MPPGATRFPQDMNSWTDEDWNYYAYRAANAIADVRDFGYAATPAAAIISAIQTVSGQGGGIVQLPYGTARITTSVAPGTGKGNFWLRGHGRGNTILSFDDTMTFGIDLNGTGGGANNLLSDVAEGDTTINLTGASGILTVGQWVRLNTNTTLDSSFITRVLSVAANSFVIEEPCPLPLTVANTAQVRLITFVPGVRISNLTLMVTGATTLQRLLNCTNLLNPIFEDVEFVHTGGEGPANASSIFLQHCRSPVISGIFSDGCLASTTGISIRATNCTNAKIVNCEVRKSSTAITVEQSPGSVIKSNTVSGTAASGGRGIKVVGPCPGTVVEGNIIVGFQNTTYTGIHSEDGWDVTIAGNTIRDIGGIGINMGGASATLMKRHTVVGNALTRVGMNGGSQPGINVTAGAGAASVDTGHIVHGNIIRDVAPGVANANGIFVGSSGNLIVANRIDNVGHDGIQFQSSAVNNQVSGNRVGTVGAGRFCINSNSAGNDNLIGPNQLSGRSAVLATANKWEQPKAVKAVTESGGGGASVDLTLFDALDISVADATAFTITITGQTTCPGMRLRVIIFNNTAGAIGAITWTGMSLAGAFTNPAAAKRRTIEFVANSAGTLIEVSRAAADI